MDFLEIVEHAERECDLVFTRTGEHRYGLLGGTLRPPQRGTLALGSSWYKPSPWQTLRVAVHTYLSLAVNISGSHFCWSEENERMVCSALGERLLLCLDLYCYEEEMRARDILDSLRSAVFVESAHFKFFQDLLVPQAELIKGSGKHLYLEKHRFSHADTVALQDRLEAIVRGICQKEARKRNKALYDEAYHASTSIESYLDGMRAENPKLEALAFEICMDTPEGNELALNRDVPRAHYQVADAFPENFLRALTHAREFITFLKKLRITNINGHLIKLSVTAWGEPRCTVILIGPEVKRLLDKHTAQTSPISLAWADFILGPRGKLEGRLGQALQAPGIHLLQDRSWTLSAKQDSSWAEFRQFVEAVFVKELPFMRLSLPRRRRGWSKGQ